MLADADVPVAAAPAQPEAADTYATELRLAEKQINAGELQLAREKLLALEHAGHSDSQLQFLLGLVAFSLKDYTEAIRRFRHILANEPDAVRVRLELGRTYYARGDLRNSERQFQFVRSTRLPAPVRRKVDGFLSSIRQKRTFEVGVSLAIAPDTNINAGPSIDNVLLFGLPFQLSPDARASSGVGIAVGGRLQWTPHLSSRMRWDVDVAGAARRYGRSQFNDTSLALATGPHVVLDRIDASVHARYSRRWFGGPVFANAHGGSFDLTYHVSGRTGIVAGVGISRLSYPTLPAQNGVLQEYSLGLYRSLSPSSLGRVTLFAGRQGALQPALANKTLGTELNYLRETGGGFTFNLAARYRRTRFEARLPAFSAVRRDDQIAGQITLLNRRIDVEGFTPTLTFIQTRNLSNNALFRFRRSQFEFGVARVF